MNTYYLYDKATSKKVGELSHKDVPIIAGNILSIGKGPIRLEWHYNKYRLELKR